MYIRMTASKCQGDLTMTRILPTIKRNGILIALTLAVVSYSGSLPGAADNEAGEAASQDAEVAATTGSQAGGADPSGAGGNDSANGKPSSSGDAGKASQGASSTESDQAVAKDEEQQLRRMGEAIKRIKRAAMDLIGECTQPMQMMGEIDIIGTDVIPIMPMTAEGFGGQYLPPRPKYVRLHMGQFEDLEPILRDEIKNLSVPPEEKEFAAPLLASMNELMEDIKIHYDRLEASTKGTEYDQLLITNEARALHKAAGDIDKLRKKLLHEDIKVEHELEKESKEEGK